MPGLQTPPSLEREYRGLWVATVANIDWPSKPGLSSDIQRAELLAILDKAAELKFNVIVLQVRPANLDDVRPFAGLPVETVAHRAHRAHTIARHIRADRIRKRLRVDRRNFFGAGFPRIVTRGRTCRLHTHQLGHPINPTERGKIAQPLPQSADDVAITNGDEDAIRRRPGQRR